MTEFDVGMLSMGGGGGWGVKSAQHAKKALKMEIFENFFLASISTFKMMNLVLDTKRFDFFNAIEFSKSALPISPSLPQPQ